MPRIRSDLLRVSAFVFQSAENARELSQHVEAAEWRPSLHQRRNSHEESPQADPKSVANEADSKLVQHRHIDADEAGQEEHSHITQSGFS